MPQFGAIGVTTPYLNGAASTAAGQNPSLPSPSIWGSCDGSSLQDNPDGFWIDENFKKVVTAPGLPSQNGTWTIPASGTDSALNLAFASTAVSAMFVRPLAPIAPNGKTKLWTEIGLNILQSTAQHMFFGLATSTGLSSTLLATSTTLLGTAGLIGFWMHADAPTNLDAIYQKPSGAVSTVLASVLTAGSNNSDPGNPLYVPATPPGVITGAQGYLKLGVRTDKQYAYFYVNGTIVAKVQIDTTFDTADSYGVVFAASTGTANTDNVAVNFLRAAARLN
jgi:hypothetical protein